MSALHCVIHCELSGVEVTKKEETCNDARLFLLTLFHSKLLAVLFFIDAHSGGAARTGKRSPPRDRVATQQYSLRDCTGSSFLYAGSTFIFRKT